MITTIPAPSAPPVPPVPIPTAPRELGYRHEFRHNEFAAIKACVDAHGFAVVKSVISRAWVDEIKASIWDILTENNPLRPGETRFNQWFVEQSKPFARLLEYEPFLEVNRALLQSREMTLHRTAALLKSVGAGVGPWHTDWTGRKGPPQAVDDVLNRGEVPAGIWFYLNGTHPARGGLALIEDSHRPDWAGPEGFEFTHLRKSFYRKGAPAVDYAGMDVPGIVPLFTDPGDLIVFASRTYHGVYPHHGSEPRFSCAANFRAGRHSINAPWPLTDSAQKFIDAQPAHIKPLVEYYTGLDRTWTPE